MISSGLCLIQEVLAFVARQFFRLEAAAEVLDHLQASVDFWCGRFLVRDVAEHAFG